jgi:hypothetical protein
MYRVTDPNGVAQFVALPRHAHFKERTNNIDLVPATVGSARLNSCLLGLDVEKSVAEMTGDCFRRLDRLEQARGCALGWVHVRR